MRRDNNLTTIMFTDIVGYTSLSSQNESNALGLLEFNAQLHTFLIEQFDGVKLKEIGDGTLATFESAIDAANCAVSLQQYVMHYKKFRLRIGLHVGDVLACSNDELGNSVNISARIQGAAAPDTIAVSQVLHDTINNHSMFSFKELGEVYLKGIIEPFTLFELLYVPITPQPLDLKRLPLKVNKQKGSNTFVISLCLGVLLVLLMMGLSYY